MSAERPALVLASASERRRELLASAGVTFEVIVREVQEVPLAEETPRAFAGRIAREKAEAVAAPLHAMGDLRPVLAADTVVTIDGVILGKPRDREDARRMLALLAGREHTVITAYCLLSPSSTVQDAVATQVRFRALSGPQIERYLARSRWDDKAGAYAIQGEAGALVKSIKGSHSCVIGLPLCEVVERLRRLPGFEELA